MIVYVADAYAHFQRLDSVAKMATMLQGCTTEAQHSVLRFLGAKGLNAKNVSYLQWEEFIA
jgi:hypothetical protein